MFTQLSFSYLAKKGYQLFPKILFVLVCCLVSISPQEVQGQITIEIEDWGCYSFQDQTQELNLHQNVLGQSKPYGFTQAEIYPNPFQSRLTIAIPSDEELTYLELLNEEGNSVWEQNVYGTPNQFTIRTLEAGTYYMNLYISGVEYTEALIHQP